MLLLPNSIVCAAVPPSSDYIHQMIAGRRVAGGRIASSTANDGEQLGNSAHLLRVKTQSGSRFKETDGRAPGAVSCGPI